MTLAASNFGAFHAAVHGGKQPFAWQQRLLEQIVRDKAWPHVLDLPTGAGKTTCIDIALFALALDATNEGADRWCARRIAMVVDRRIVVDQVAERGRSILRALMTSTDAIVAEVARRLRSLTRTGEEPLGVFTLRGGMPKDDGWARTPDQPLVIASTVDQVGSRMLMQGYGVSQGMKPVHAGLLANDTLLLLDEVHLSEPFRQTLAQLARVRTRFSGSGVKTRFAHAFLSATPGGGTEPPFALLHEEKEPDSPLGPRLHASKPVRLVEVDDRTALEKACVDQAKDLLERHRAIAVVVNRLASASVIARQLGETLGTDAKVTLLTGRMRPLDRDDVLRDLRPAVQTGRNRSDDSPKRVIVGTQCIEAGADFDFDALVTEAASLDSLRQRFGRVDRLGRYKKAEGRIVHDKSAKDDPIYGKAIAETVKWFKAQERERSKELKDELKKLKNDAKKLNGEAKQQAEAHIATMALVDFGVLALKVPTGDDLTNLLGRQVVADLKPPPDDFKMFLATCIEAWLTGKDEAAGFAAAYGTDIAVDGKGNIKPTAFHFTAANQTFLGAVEVIRASVTQKWVETSLFEGHGEQPGSNLRWDPGAERNWALMANNPNDDGTRVDAPLEWLAFRGLPLLPSFPRGSRIITTGVVGRGDDMTFTWPLWCIPASLLTTRSAIQVDWTGSIRERAARGVFAICSSAIRRTSQGFGNFGPSSVMS